MKKYSCQKESKTLIKKVKVKLLSRVLLFATPWSVACEVPPTMEFSRQEYWSGLLLPFVIIMKIHV